MFLTKIVAALVPWLWQATCFSPALSMLLPWRPRAVAYAAFVQPHDAHAAVCRRCGVLTVARLSQSVNDNISGFHYDQEPRGTSYISQVSKQDLWEKRQMRRPRSWQARQRRPAPNSRGAFTPRDSRENVVNDGGFNPLTNEVSANLKAVSVLLNEMKESQLSQSSDVQALSLKVADIAERLSQTEMKSRMSNQNSSVGTKDRNFGTSLDGEFHRKIKDVIDQFDMVDAASKNGSAAGQQSSQDYYARKISQLESKIDKIDDALKETEERVNDQMEYVDMVVNQRLDEVDEVGTDGMPFMEEGPPPPPPLGEILPPPPPPRPQEGYGNIHADDGRAYYQERNYNDPSAPRPLEIPLAREGQSGKSANERSEGHHYGEKNSSFISSFSKADNERRREFRPFEDPRRTPNRTGPGEQLPRGPRAPFNRHFVQSPPPPPVEPVLPGYLEGPDFYEDGPMMEAGYYFDGMYGL